MSATSATVCVSSSPYASFAMRHAPIPFVIGQALASILVLFGTVSDQPDPASLKKIPTIARGRLLCDAYEAYRRVSPRPRIDFEHAAFLAKALTQGDEIRLRFCPACQALNIVETVALRDPACRACDVPIPEKSPSVRGPRPSASPRSRAGC